MLLLLLAATMVFTFVVVDGRAQHKFPENWGRQDKYVKTWGIGLGVLYLLIYAVILYFQYF